MKKFAGLQSRFSGGFETAVRSVFYAEIRSYLGAYPQLTGRELRKQRLLLDLTQSELAQATWHVAQHDQGVHPRVVMETLGHSQISMTLDTYSHVLPSLQSEAAKRLDDALGEIGCQNGCQGSEKASADVEKTQDSEESLVNLNFTSWNHLDAWLRRVDRLWRVG